MSNNYYDFAPGADITDYFNYGFTEETWRLYCDKQRKMKTEVGNLNKIAVSLQVTQQTWYSSVHVSPVNETLVVCAAYLLTIYDLIIIITHVHVHVCTVYDVVITSMQRYNYIYLYRIV